MVGDVGHRVPPLSAEGAAATDASQAHQAAPHRAMELDGLSCVGGARWLEAAGRAPARSGGLVEADPAQDQASTRTRSARCAHGPTWVGRMARSRARRRSRRTATKASVATGAPALMMTAPIGSGPVAPISARAARKRRRTRLRTTAVPVRRPTAKATRQRSSWGDGRKRTLTGPDRPRWPCSLTASMVRRSRRGAIRPTGGLDPCDAGCAARRGRLESTSACETRGASSVGGRWAGRCASRLSSSGTATSWPDPAA